MSKEIPKRPGQKFNGVFPSVFALAFLMVGVPVLSTFIVEGALYLGDSSKYVSAYDREDVILGGEYQNSYPFWVQSGDGDDSKCTQIAGSLTDPGGANCTASWNLAYTAQQTYEAVTDGTRWHQGLPHCSSSNVTSNCGSSGYIIGQNITERLEIDRIFPNIYYYFSNDVELSCDDSRTGPSRVDYTITISHIMREPLFSGTNIWTYGYLENSMSFSGVETFDNYVEVDDDPCKIRAQIEVSHNIDFIEIEELTSLLDNYWQNKNETFGVYMTIELNNLRTKSGYSWESVSFYNPFTIGADGNHEMYLDFNQFKLDPFNTFLKFGVIGMGIGFWFIALASTPYWDPFIKKVKKNGGNP